MFSPQTDEFCPATPKSLFDGSFIKRMGRNGPYIEEVGENVDYSSVSRAYRYGNTSCVSHSERQRHYSQCTAQRLRNGDQEDREGG